MAVAVLGLAAPAAVAPIQRQPLKAPRLCADLRPPKPAASSRIAFQDNHDQLYNSLVEWTTTTPARKRTLVHFDYHSDLYRNDSHLHAAVNVGNFTQNTQSLQDFFEKLMGLSQPSE